jgi:uncharacterized membrane protein
MSYHALEVVHLFGVTIFIGNIVVTGVWKALADRTRDARIIAYAQRVVTLTDWIFTAGGAVLILAGGYGMAAVAGLDVTKESWLLWGQGLFGISGLIWIAILIPTQALQAKEAREFAKSGEIPESYWRNNRRWLVWGTIATLPPLANLYVMVFKP